MVGPCVRRDDPLTDALAQLPLFLSRLLVFCCFFFVFFVGEATSAESVNASIVPHADTQTTPFF